MVAVLSVVGCWLVFGVLEYDVLVARLYLMCKWQAKVNVIWVRMSDAIASFRV
jgi:hypothetical protein